MASPYRNFKSAALACPLCAPAYFGYRNFSLGFGPEQLRKFLHPARRAEQEALHLAAAERLDLLQLLSGFHALGRGRHSEMLCKACDCQHDRHRIVARRQPADEATIDLDLVEWKAPQIAERRVAGAEIVHR